MKIIIPLLLSCFCCITLFAKDNAPTGALTIAELVDIALQNNPETSAAWARAQRAAANLGMTSSSYYPSLTFRADATRGYDYRFPTGHEATIISAGGDFILSYLLLDCGERAATRSVARAGLLAAGWQSDWTMQKVFFSAINYSYQLLRAQEILDAHTDTLRDTKSTFDAIEELHHAGVRSITDLETQRGAFLEASIAVAQQKAEVAIARGQLATAMGLPVDSNITVIPLPDPTADEALQRDLPTLLRAAELQRADLMAKRAELQQKSAQIRKVQASYRPKLRFEGTTGLKHYVHDSSHGYRYNAVIALDCPLFRGFESLYNMQMAASEYQIADLELADLQLKIALEVLTHSSRFAAAQELLTLARDNLSNSQSTYEGVLEKYKAGTATIFDLTQVQRMLAAARVRLSETKTGWYTSLAQLAYATGSITSEERCSTAP
jgi:outer membrane protein TolC